MDHSANPFIGFAPTKINPKRRVCLPLIWHNRLPGSFTLFLDDEHDLIRIQLVPEPVLTEWIEQSVPPSGESQSGKIGPRGTVTLPGRLFEAAGIAAPGDLIVMGRGRFIEFWSVANFNAHMSLYFALVENEDDCPEP